jgi:hypothetical protein
MNAMEKHYSVPQVSSMWGCSKGKVRQLFKDEPDVMRIGSGETRTKRSYFTMMIPETALRRVYARLTKRP